jgi:hypothetical protein
MVAGASTDGMTETPCPLCRKELNIPAKPDMPSAILARLARHFADDCEATEHVMPASTQSRKAPQRS